jgi:hypothetical protein
MADFYSEITAELLGKTPQEISPEERQTIKSKFYLWLYQQNPSPQARIAEKVRSVLSSLGTPVETGAIKLLVDCPSSAKMPQRDLMLVNVGNGSVTFMPAMAGSIPPREARRLRDWLNHHIKGDVE